MLMGMRAWHMRATDAHDAFDNFRSILLIFPHFQFSTWSYSSTLQSHFFLKKICHKLRASVCPLAWSRHIASHHDEWKNSSRRPSTGNSDDLKLCITQQRDATSHWAAEWLSLIWPRSCCVLLLWHTLARRCWSACCCCYLAAWWRRQCLWCATSRAMCLFVWRHYVRQQLSMCDIRVLCGVLQFIDVVERILVVTTFIFLYFIILRCWPASYFLWVKIWFTDEW